MLARYSEAYEILSPQNAFPSSVIFLNVQTTKETPIIKVDVSLFSDYTFNVNHASWEDCNPDNIQDTTTLSS